MTYKLTTHVFPLTNQAVQTILIDGEPWFMGKDVLKVLDLGSDAYQRLDYDQRSLVAKTHLKLSGRGRPLMFISEAGLFRLIMRSHKPEAVKFQNWVTDTVLPAIRKDGMYVMGEENMDLSTEEGLKAALLLLPSTTTKVTYRLALCLMRWGCLGVHSGTRSPKTPCFHEPC